MAIDRVVTGHQCECCRTPRTVYGFVCQCTIELFCRTCNHCRNHCACPVGVQNLDVPLTEQLAIAKYELRRLGVAA